MRLRPERGGLAEREHEHGRRRVHEPWKEDQEVQQVHLGEFLYKGEKYLKDTDDRVYDFERRTVIGVYDEESDVLNMADE